MYIDIEFVVHFLNRLWTKLCSSQFQLISKFQYYFNPYYNFSGKLLVHDLTQYLKKSQIGFGSYICRV